MSDAPRRSMVMVAPHSSPHWDHDAVANRGSTAQQVAILGWSLLATPQVQRIGRFLTTDDCAKATQQFMFCNEPIGATIPPRYRRKRGVKSNVRQTQQLSARREPWCPSQKPAIGNTLIETPPIRCRHRFAGRAPGSSASKSGGFGTRQAGEPLDPPGSDLFAHRRVVESRQGSVAISMQVARIDSSVPALSWRNHSGFKRAMAESRW